MESERFAAAEEWEDFVSRSFYALAMESAVDRFTAVARLAALSRGVRLSEVATSAPTSLRRTASLVRSNPSEDLLFLIQLAGRSRLEQAGTQLVLGAGEATFCDPSVPYTIETSGHQVVAMVPRHEVLPARATSAAVRLRPLSLDLAPLRVFRLLAEEMISTPGGERDLETGSVAGAATELLRSAARAAVGDDAGARSLSREHQLSSVKDYLVTRLMDPGLRLEQVAADNAMSLRQLTAVFAPEDSPAAYIRRERLRRAHRDLTDPGFAAVPVAAVAARWGFADASTFGRAFRREYGCSPQAARAEAGPSR
ncbi:helix-turn-helix domain-containing protein [Nocardioides bruguierae]|uniref:Helix-turn-helix domain-containing protein n=1 Tax=Nocardioides bruguierae TaxID=2945102 RepID=A0A9X2IF19_9ACTN|nr:helix-turn-helix domain-containing protein [Nocardioides bruguierae]MCM0621396.1 helix-turn-helix domain-containing protein [Nocardioides bruguierae]